MNRAPSQLRAIGSDHGRRARRAQIIRSLRAFPAVGEPQVGAVSVGLRRQITPPYLQYPPTASASYGGASTDEKACRLRPGGYLR